MRWGFGVRLAIGMTTLLTTFVISAVAVVSIQIAGFAKQQISLDLNDSLNALRVHVQSRRTALRDEAAFLARAESLVEVAQRAEHDDPKAQQAFDEIQQSFAASVLILLDAKGQVLASRGARCAVGDEWPGQRTHLVTTVRLGTRRH